MDPRPRPVLGRRGYLIAGAVAAVLIAAIGTGVYFYARGGGPLPQWAGFLRSSTNAVLQPSPPAEVVLRTLRLAGYQRAAVGEKDGTVVVRVESPSLGSSADVALTWQTGMAAASAAYPKAAVLVVQVFVPAQPLLEVSAPAAAVTAAVRADDAALLRRACTFRYLSEAGGG
ncbi:MAG: hypothetical protein Q7W16_06040 [Coriobacteriia bacterium]|nr:hypothetical protein [Coriobacteriia bacterium]